MSKPEVSIYTDGACSGNPGPGGWAALLETKGKEKTISGGEARTTNNRMELKAAIEGLRALKKPCKVVIHSDSALLVNTFNKGWIDNWLKRDWRKADKKPVENQDLWKALLNAMKPHEVKWVKVKGHANNEKNNLVDELAVAAAKKYQK
ncbi:MAG TPA: ribonuclease HI [Balneolales bacterium]|nr:ribonuclease HI [Balneolales bacterium]